MSKVLIFKDGTEMNFTESSTVTDCVTVLGSFSEVDEIRAKFTAENLKGATFDGDAIKDIVPVSASAEADVDGNVTVHFINRAKTHDEIVDEQLLELQSAMADMMA